MSDALSNIGQFFNSSGGRGILEGGVAGGGLIQNLLANREAQKKQKFVEDIITNPAKLQQFVAGFNKPLTAGLEADVARSADAYGAERGLGSSPAVMKDVYAQALAPYVQQQQNQAMQSALQSLGVYEASPTTKPVDVSSLLKVLMMNPQQQQSGGVTGQMPPDSSVFGLTPDTVNSFQLPTPTIADSTSTPFFGSDQG